jgi:hypothetical protein
MIATAAEANTEIRPDDTAQPTSLAHVIPTDCDPSRYLDWRLRYAAHLIQNNSQSPITLKDPWVQAALDYLIADRSGWEDRKPNILDVAIAAAQELKQEGSLAKSLLEARLLSQEDPEEICDRCHLSKLTICAYLMLLFDVRGRDRKGIWLLRPLSNGAATDSAIGQFGFALKHLACFKTSEDFEAHVDALCRLEGKTMADGLPDRATPGLIQELTLRLTLANSLLPDTGRTHSLLQRFDTAVMNDVKNGQPSDETINLGIEILQKAKIGKSLRAEIEQLRRFCQPAEVAATGEASQEVAAG